MATSPCSDPRRKAAGTVGFLPASAVRATIATLVLHLSVFLPTAQANAPCPLPADVSVATDTVESFGLTQACDSVELNRFSVEAGATGTAQASGTVSLRPGVDVAIDGALQVIVASPDLSNVAPRTTAAQVLSTLYLEGLPANVVSGELGNLELQVIAPDIPEAAPMPVLVDETGGRYFYVPFNPTDPLSPGSINLQVVAAGAASPVFSIDVTPLPEAPGAWMDSAIASRALVEAWAVALGTTYADVVATALLETAPEYVGVKMNQLFVDDPNSNYDLLGFADGSSGLFTEDELRIIDQVIAWSGQTAFLEAEIVRINELAQKRSSLLPTGPAIATAQPSRLSMGAEATTVAAGMPVVAASGASCIYVDSEYPDGPSLAAATWAATEGKIANKNSGYLTAASAVNTVGGVILGPLAKAFFFGQNATMTATGINYDYAAGMFPSEFTNITVLATPTIFNEDFLQPGQVTSVKVESKSTGWNADGAVVKTALTALSAVPLAKSLSPAEEVSQTALEALKKTARENLEKALAAGAGLAAGQLVTGGPTPELYEVLDNGLFNFCPRVWETEIRQPGYVDLVAVDGGLTVDTTTFSYEPSRVGPAVLTVGTKDNVYGSAFIKTDIPIETLPLEVHLEPSLIAVTTPGDVVNIDASVINADNPALSWFEEQGQFVDGLGSVTDFDGLTRALQTPTDESAYPFTVTAESLSSSGLLATNPQVIRARIMVGLETQAITISPTDACIAPGNSKQFSAFDSDGNPIDVVWALQDQTGAPSSVGSISSGGVYTAPAPPSDSATVIVTARLPDATQPSAFAKVDVGPCTCEWSMSIPDLGYESTGRYVEHYFPGDKTISDSTLSFQYFESYTRPEVKYGLVSLVDPLDASSVGGPLPVDQFQFWFSPTAGYCLGGYSLASQGLPPSPVDLTIEQNNDSSILGSVTGSCVYLDIVNGGIQSVPFTFSFKSDRVTNGRLCDEPN